MNHNAEIGRSSGCSASAKCSMAVSCGAIDHACIIWVTPTRIYTHMLIDTQNQAISSQIYPNITYNMYLFKWLYLYIHIYIYTSRWRSVASSPLVMFCIESHHLGDPCFLIHPHVGAYGAGIFDQAMVHHMVPLWPILSKYHSHDDSFKLLFLWVILSSIRFKNSRIHKKGPQLYPGFKPT